MSDDIHPPVLGIDYGLVRVGIAISDPLRLTAQPVTTIKASTTDALITAIEEIVVRRGVCRVVVGLPLNMDGSEGTACEAVREFAGLLGGRLGLEVVLQDERLSTVRAERVMLEADVSRARRARARDVIAAQLILQSYLDAQRSRE